MYTPPVVHEHSWRFDVLISQSYTNASNNNALPLKRLDIQI